MTSMLVICGLGHPQSKILATSMVTNGYKLSSVAATSDVIGQFYVRLFFVLDLVLIIIKLRAKFKL